VRERLVERAGGGRFTGGGQPVLDDLLGLAGLVGVVGQPGQLDAWELGERGEHLPVAGHAGAGRQPLEDGASGELVPEPDVGGVGLQHASTLGLVQRRGVIVRQALDQPALDLAGDRRQQLQRPLRAVAELPEPGEHRVTDRRRHVHVRAGEHLGDEEGVAAGGVEHRARIRAVPGGELLDRAGRQPPQREPLHVLAGERAEHPPQRMVVAQLVVAVGEHQHAGQLRDTPGEVADDVQGGVVGPVHVLDDHQRGPVGELLVHGAEDRVPLRDRRRGLGQRPVAAAGHVPERTQRARRHQVVAHADQHASVRPRVLRERPDQARLADPGLAGDQHHRATIPAGLAQRLPQPAELRVTLEQARRHATIEAPRSAQLNPTLVELTYISQD
jgi:hypothetical protein